MSIPSWLDAAGPDGRTTWDVLVVAGKAFPGLADVEVNRKYRVDKKDEAGVNGATLTGLGHMPADVKIKLRIWTAEQFNQFQELLPLVMPKPNKKEPSAVTVHHPQLALLSVRSLYFEQIGSLQPTGIWGVREVHMEATEFLPKKASGKPVVRTATSSSVDAPVNPTLPRPSNAPVPPADNPADQGP